MIAYSHICRPSAVHDLHPDVPPAPKAGLEPPKVRTREGAVHDIPADVEPAPRVKSEPPKIKTRDAATGVPTDHTTLAGLARISLEGKDAIRATVVELEKSGYIHRSRTTDRAGKFSSNEYIIREYPASYDPSPEGPSSAQPLTENPTTDKPSTA